MAQKTCLCTIGLFVLVLGIVPFCKADHATFALDNNAWDGNANLGVYPPSSGALIDYEIYVRIEDDENDGYESQGLTLFVADILTNTGIQQPLLTMSPTTEDYPYTIIDDLWTAGKTPAAVGGFGMGFIYVDGDQWDDDVVGAGATMPINWIADTSNAPGTTPFALSGIGIGTPGIDTYDSGGNLFPPFGTARSEWYLLRGQTIVPDAPGDYVVDLAVPSFNVIRNSADLNNDVTNGIAQYFPQRDITTTGFTFSVTPEPAFASAVLLATGLLVRRRRIRKNDRSHRQRNGIPRSLLCALIAAGVLASPSLLRADQVTIALDNNAWAGNPNLGTYPPSSGATIDYELFVQIEDTELDGYDSQGLINLDVQILSNTNIQQPLVEASPTTLEYSYTILDPTWTGGPMPVALDGFGLSALDPGVNNVPGNVLGVTIAAPLTWLPDSSPAAGITPRALAGVGIGTPGVGTFDTGGNAFPFYGTARSEWYLVRGQTIVPDAPGQYEITPNVIAYGVIGLGYDLNDVASGYIDEPGRQHSLTEVGYSFTVTPEPATACVLLLAAAGLLHCRRRMV